MSCLTSYTLKGIHTDCEPNLAGIVEVWIGFYGDYDVEVQSIANSGASAHSVTSISGDPMQHYEFAKQTGSLTSTLTNNEANGTRYYTNEIVLAFNRMEGKKHLEIQALGSEKLVAIVHDLNDKYWYVGYDGYLSAASSTSQTGQSYDDNNGYNITLDAMSAYLPFEMTKAQVDSVTSA
jgi:hypothetical protein